MIHKFTVRSRRTGNVIARTATAKARTRREAAAVVRGRYAFPVRVTEF